MKHPFIRLDQAVKPLAAALLLLLGLTLTGCSSWGGKLRNSEGLRYYNGGKYDEALASFQTAARLNPEDPEIYYNIASTYQRQATEENKPALFTQAENYYRQCLDRNPSPETTVCCYRGLATVLTQRNQSAEAMNLLRAWEERDPTSVEPKLEIAYLLEAQGANRDAAAALEKIAAYAPNDYRAYYKLGLIHEKLGEDDAALEQLRAASRLNPNDTQITQQIALIQSKRNNLSSGDANSLLAGSQPAADQNAAGAPGQNPAAGAAANPSYDNLASGTPQGAASDPFAPRQNTTQIPQTQATTPTAPEAITPEQPSYGAPAATAAPSYDTPATGASSVEPIGSLPLYPESTYPVNNDPAGAAGDPQSSAVPNTQAPPTLPEFPDGNGANPLGLSVPAAPANNTISQSPAAGQEGIPAGQNSGVTSSNVAAVASAAPPIGQGSQVTERKQRVSDPPSGPPITSIGAPY